MGSPCVPSYANLLLGCWDPTIVFGNQQHSLADEIDLIWNGSTVKFEQFMKILNSIEIGLGFTSEIKEHSLPFLDILISKSDTGELSTTIYRKPTATYSLLS